MCNRGSTQPSFFSSPACPPSSHLYSRSHCSPFPGACNALPPSLTDKLLLIPQDPEQFHVPASQHYWSTHASLPKNNLSSPHSRGEGRVLKYLDPQQLQLRALETHHDPCWQRWAEERSVWSPRGGRWRGGCRFRLLSVENKGPWVTRKTSMDLGSSDGAGQRSGAV